MAEADEFAGMLIVFGRFVPGLRFVVGAIMGSPVTPIGASSSGARSGVCPGRRSRLSSYLVGSVIDDRPVVSMLVSIVITTALLVALYQPLKRGWQDQAAPSPPT
ncbi:MAG: hypothetical protein GY708_18520 [Actinomycetia bacterium]|nr:hypothetical protein [Actinomycetes bacterium]